MELLYIQGSFEGSWEVTDSSSVCLIHCYSIYLTLRRRVKYWELILSRAVETLEITLSTLKTWTFQPWTRLYCWPLPTPLSRGPPMSEKGSGVLAWVISELKNRTAFTITLNYFTELQMKLNWMISSGLAWFTQVCFYLDFHFEFLSISSNTLPTTIIISTNLGTLESS